VPAEIVYILLRNVDVKGTDLGRGLDGPGHGDLQLWKARLGSDPEKREPD
jgi:hypothetical protein